MQLLRSHYIGLDFSTVPIYNLVLLLGCVIVLLIILPIATVYVVRKLNIKNVGSIKIGGTSSTGRSYTERLIVLEDACRKELFRLTSKMRITFNNALAREDICYLTLIGLASSLRCPLYESVANNHLTTELTTRYDIYRERLIDMLKEEYEALLAAYTIRQTSEKLPPPWDKASKKIILCADAWLKRISGELMATCEKKINLGKHELSTLDDIRDKTAISIIRQNIAKNEQYKTVLKSYVSRNIYAS